MSQLVVEASLLLEKDKEALSPFLVVPTNSLRSNRKHYGVHFWLEQTRYLHKMVHFSQRCLKSKPLNQSLSFKKIDLICIIFANCNILGQNGLHEGMDEKTYIA